ncbi:MAG: glycosidase [Candidatus Brocadiia bacterium]
MKLERLSPDPVLTPREDVPWEKDAVLNPAAVHHRGRVHLLYRAVAHRPGDRNRSSIGYAWSDDGLHFHRLDQPVLRPGQVPGEAKGVEDPRVTRIGETFHMLYTAYDGTKTEVARATSADLRSWRRQGVAIGHELFGDNKDAALFPRTFAGRYAALHRPPPNIVLSYSRDLAEWTDHAVVMGPEQEWERAKIGAGAQPIRTDAGWVCVYHGVAEGHVYRLGIALLDLEEPSKVLRRQAEPILEPETEWERRGEVPNVVFACGAVLLGRELWVYYGGADSVIGVARGDIREFLD